MTHQRPQTLKINEPLKRYYQKKYNQIPSLINDYWGE